MNPGSNGDRGNRYRQRFFSRIGIPASYERAASSELGSVPSINFKSAFETILKFLKEENQVLPPALSDEAKLREFYDAVVRLEPSIVTADFKKTTRPEQGAKPQGSFFDHKTNNACYKILLGALETSSFLINASNHGQSDNDHETLTSKNMALINDMLQKLLRAFVIYEKNNSIRVKRANSAEGSVSRHHSEPAAAPLHSQSVPNVPPQQRGRVSRSFSTKQ